MAEATASPPEASAPAKLTVADVAAKLAELEASLPDRIGEHVEKVAGPIIEKEIAAAIAGAGTDGELASFVDHVNAKVHAIHNALQRAVGISVPLPLQEDPADKPVGEITVTGAETAQA